MESHSSNNLSVGYKGQTLARNYLVKKGYKIVCENYRSGRWGEIDLVALGEGVIVFVEVKTRNSEKYGKPYEAVTYYKLKALRRCAEYFLVAKKVKLPARIDVVSVLLIGNLPKIEHYKGF